jgi:hypothetical protein
MTFRNGKTQPKPEKALVLKFAARGWAVLPLHTIRDGHCSCTDGPNCAHPGKHPLTPHGVKDATTALTGLATQPSLQQNGDRGVEEQVAGREHRHFHRGPV